jgi:hypothetical protein
MAIVRNDRRGTAIENIASARQAFHETLRTVDGGQAALDELELSLGLANEGEQAQREQYLVMHFGKGDATGHTLDECDDKGCADRGADDLLEGLQASAVEGEEADEGEGEGEEEKPA